MEWYYVDNGHQAGPVSELELQQLVLDGKITPQTLVWCEGMENWEPYATIQAKATAPEPPPMAPPAFPSVQPTTYGEQPTYDPTAPFGQPSSLGQPAPYGQTPAMGSAEVAYCTSCGRMFPSQDMVRFGQTFVCAACKPGYVQRLKEGAPVFAQLNLASMGNRFVARLIDGLIIGVPIVVLMVIAIVAMGENMEDPNAGMILQMIIQIPLLIVQLAYETFFLGRSGATPGKKLMKIKVVREDGGPIGYSTALGRCAIRYLAAWFCCIVALVVTVMDIMAIWDPERRTLPDKAVKTRVVVAE